MTRIASVLMTVMMIGAAVGVAPLIGFAQSPGDAGTAAGAATDDGRLAATGTGTNESVPPGAMLSGVVGVQEAEIEGEIRSRAFGIKVARAGSNASKASVVAGEVNNASERLEELRQRKEELRRARENGSITNATFKAEMAEVAARTETVMRLANQSEAVASGLPDELLEERGVNTSALRTLRGEAARLAGPEVAEIARSIAGPGVGKSIGPGRMPRDAGPPGNVLHGNESDGGPPDDAPGGNGTDLPGGNGTDVSDDGLPGNETAGGSGADERTARNGSDGGNDTSAGNSGSGSDDTGDGGNSGGGSDGSDAGDDTTSGAGGKDDG